MTEHAINSIFRAIYGTIAALTIALLAVSAVVAYEHMQKNAAFEAQQEIERAKHACWYYGNANGGTHCKHARKLIDARLRGE